MPEVVNKRADIEPPRRLLIRGVNWLGDVIMTMPAICRLREAFPDTHIGVLTFPKLADIYRLQPAIDSIITLDRNESPVAVAARLRAERFDTGLILPNSIRTVMPFWLAGIPRRVGYGGRGRSWLLTDPVRRGPGIARIRKRPLTEIGRLTGQPVPSEGLNGLAGLARSLVRPTSLQSNRSGSDPHHLHHIHAYLQLITRLGASDELMAPQLVVPEANARALRERFQIPPAGSGPLFGLNPGAEYGLAKRWPEERFIETAITLHRRFGCRWLVLGGPSDRELASRIANSIATAIGAGTGESRENNRENNKENNRENNREQGSGATEQRVWNLAGQTSLPELCAALRICDLVLTNDTGPMHVAAAVGTRVVVPFGSTSAVLTGPGLPHDPRHRLLQSDAICAPCFHRVCPIDFRCMLGITVENMVIATSELYR